MWFCKYYVASTDVSCEDVADIKMVPAFMEPGTKTTVTSAQDHRHIVIIIISHSVTDSQAGKVLTMRIKIHCTSKTKQLKHTKTMR